MKIRLEFKLQDCWIGVYWNKKDVEEMDEFELFINKGRTVDIYICLIPCFSDTY